MGGWNWLINSRVEHYFVEGRSLCGRWMIFAPDTGIEDAPGNYCMACLKKLAKRRADKVKCVQAVP